MAIKAAIRLVQLFEGWKNDMLLTAPADIFHKILLESGYMDAVKTELEKDPDAESRLQNLDALINAVKEYEERCERNEKEPSVADFLQEISLLSGEDDTQAGSEGAVTLMTVHLAKGLEFNDVFVTGLEENLFPIGCSSDDDLEEERRLCYVAMTRAKQRLFLSYAQTRRKFGQLQQNTPSRFLFETGLVNETELNQNTPARYTDFRTKYGLYGADGRGGYSGGNYSRFEQRKRTFGSNNFEGYAAKSRFQKRYDKDGYEIEENQDLDYTQRTFSASAGLGNLYAQHAAGFAKPVFQQPPAAKPGEVAVGGLVKHGVFGKGKIIQVTGSGDNAKITVLFGNGTRRTFMLKFAPLEIL
jgi:DNA helicase-2/ATP-dependent DNA helicase PcrA